MKITRPDGRTNWLMAGGAALFILASCATPPPTAKKAANPIFYPMPPDPPRVQFLVSFSNSEDLLGGESNKFATFVTGKASPKIEMLKPYGLAIARGKIEVCDTVVNTIHVLDLTTHQMQSFSPRGEAIMRIPINLTIDKDGTHYVADTGRNQVLIFGPDQSYQGAIGGKDEMKPTDVAVSDTRVYITDLKGHTVRVYEKQSRKLLFTIPSGVITKTNQLFSPTNLALDTQGRLFVSDTGSMRVQQFDSEGKYLRTFAKQGDAPGELARPKGVAVDREGRVYVVDAATQVLQMWDAEGRLLLFFGEPGTTPASLNLPAKVVVDYDHVELFRKYAAPGFKLEHLILVSNQYGDRKVSVFGFGSK